MSVIILRQTPFIYIFASHNEAASLHLPSLISSPILKQPNTDITMHLVLTGATGLVGSAVLHQMLTTPSVTKLTILSRRPVAQAEGHTKANVVIHKDFSNYGSEVMEGLKDVKGVVWAQGISVNSVDKECEPLSISLFNLICSNSLFCQNENVKLMFIFSVNTKG